MKIVINDMFYLAPCEGVSSANRFDIHKTVTREKFDRATRTSTGEMHDVDEIVSYGVTLEHAADLLGHEMVRIENEGKSISMAEFRREVLAAIDKIGKIEKQ